MADPDDVGEHRKAKTSARVTKAEEKSPGISRTPPCRRQISKESARKAETLRSADPGVAGERLRAPRGRNQQTAERKGRGSADRGLETKTGEA